MLNELARASQVAMIVREGDVPVQPVVAGAAEILGIDPMYVANEGKLVAFVAPEAADAALSAMRAVEGCERAAVRSRTPHPENSARSIINGVPELPVEKGRLERARG